LDSQIFELKNVDKQVTPSLMKVSKLNIDGLKKINVDIRPVARKANFRQDETVSLVNCEHTMTNIEAKRS